VELSRRLRRGGTWPCVVVASALMTSTLFIPLRVVAQGLSATKGGDRPLVIKDLPRDIQNQLALLKKQLDPRQRAESADLARKGTMTYAVPWLIALLITNDRTPLKWVIKDTTAPSRPRSETSPYVEALEALRDITGQSFGEDTELWIEWYRLENTSDFSVVDQRLRHPRAVVRALAGARAASLQQPTRVDSVLAALRDHDAAVRRATASAIAEKGLSHDRLPAFWISQLNDSSAEVRAASTAVLGTLSDPSAIDPVVARLGDPDSTVRLYAVRALRALRDRRLVDHLANTLRTDSHWQVRAEAAESIGELGDRGAVSVLETARNDADANVRRAVADALRRVRGR